MATRRPAVPRTPATRRPTPAEGAPRPAKPADTGPAATASPKTAGAAKATTAKAQPAKAAPAKAARASSDSPRDATTPVAPEETPVPARAFSGRIIALAVVLIAITVMLAPTVRVFLGQRAEISALQADIAAKKSEQDSLRQSIARWEDSNYVKQQARDRINMVMPGETSYWVFGNVDVPAGTAGTGGTQSSGDTPWAEGFWDAFVRAATD